MSDFPLEDNQRIIAREGRIQFGKVRWGSWKAALIHYIKNKDGEVITIAYDDGDVSADYTLHEAKVELDHERVIFDCGEGYLTEIQYNVPVELLG